MSCLPKNARRNAEIIRRRKAGERPRAIARDMGLGHNVVIGVCNRAGLCGPEGRHEVALGEANGSAKLTADKVRVIRYLHKHGVRQVDLAEACGVSQLAVSRIIRGRSWKHVQ